QMRPRGHSMRPLIHSGQLVTISPDISSLKEEDIVFCRVKGAYYVHRISAVLEGDRFQISNNRGHVNGTVTRNAIYGKVIRAEPSTDSHGGPPRLSFCQARTCPPTRRCA